MNKFKQFLYLHRTPFVIGIFVGLFLFTSFVATASAYETYTIDDSNFTGDYTISTSSTDYLLVEVDNTTGSGAGWIEFELDDLITASVPLFDSYIQTYVQVSNVVGTCYFSSIGRPDVGGADFLFSYITVPEIGAYTSDDHSGFALRCFDTSSSADFKIYHYAINDTEYFNNDYSGGSGSPATTTVTEYIYIPTDNFISSLECVNNSPTSTCSFSYSTSSASSTSLAIYDLIETYQPNQFTVFNLFIYSLFFFVTVYFFGLLTFKFL